MASTSLGDRVDERSKHTVHRLEAFSDIVMGFCLAQLGLNLPLPKSPADVTSVWASTMLLITAFVGIAIIWWLYHRIFSTYFVFSMPMVIVNFGMLCGLVLTMYLFECVAHEVAAGQNPVAFFIALVIALCLVYAALAVMLLVGLRVRRDELSPSEKQWAIDQLASIAMSVPAAVAAIALSTHHAWLAVVAIVLAALIVIVHRVIVPRLASRTA